MIGEAPGGYRILFELGRGGMGMAFLARAEGAGGFERLVVIKRIRPEKLEERSVARFLREARLAAAIHHANVVGTQNVGEDAAGPFIVLDYVDGASLEDLLPKRCMALREEHQVSMNDEIHHAAVVELAPHFAQPTG